MVRIVKSTLRKVWRARLTYEELETTLIETEMVINTRPLTYLYDDECIECLTPSHLLLGRNLQLKDNFDETGEIQTEFTHSEVTSQMRYLQTLVNSFWNRKNDEKHHYNGKKKYGETKLFENDVVLIKDDDKLPRNKWKMAKIENVITGNDGEIRGAVLKVCANGKCNLITRPIQRLIPFEIVETDNNDKVDTVEVIENSTNSQEKTRSKRVAALNADLKRKLMDEDMQERDDVPEWGV